MTFWKSERSAFSQRIQIRGLFSRLYSEELHSLFVYRSWTRRMSCWCTPTGLTIFVISAFLEEHGKDVGRRCHELVPSLFHCAVQVFFLCRTLVVRTPCAEKQAGPVQFTRCSQNPVRQTTVVLQNVCEHAWCTLTSTLFVTFGLENTNVRYTYGELHLKLPF